MSRKPLALIATTLFAVFAAGTAFADKKNFFTSYAQVIHVEPIYKYHTVHKPEKHCEYIRPHRDQRHANNNNRRYFVNRKTDQQKRNHNQRVRNQHQNRGNRGRQHCVTRNVSHEVRRQDGFLVTYQYHGNKFQTRTNHHPGHQIRISVQIQPH